jgi:hypothetical protein
MKKLVLILIPFIFLIPVVGSSTIGLGVEPSLVNISLAYNKEIAVKFKFWNEGDTDTVYTIVPKPELSDFIVFDNPNYWHNETFIVPKHTSRLSGFQTKEILFRGKLNKKIDKFETGIFIYGEPVGEQEHGVVTIKRSVFVRMFVENYPEQQQQSQGQTGGTFSFFRVFVNNTSTNIPVNSPTTKVFENQTLSKPNTSMESNEVKENENSTQKTNFSTQKTNFNLLAIVVVPLLVCTILIIRWWW